MNEERSGHAALPRGRIRLREGVVRKRFASDIIVLDAASGAYYRLNSTGGAMLDALEASGSAQGAAQWVSDELGAPLETVASDLAKLCRTLDARGLISIAE